MKAMIKSLMVIGMMILSTATGLANNNIDKKFEPAHRTEYREHIHGFDKKMHKHFKKGKHHFDKHGHCKKCHYTEHEIHRLEREMYTERHHHNDAHHGPHRGHGDHRTHKHHTHRH